MQTIIKTEKTTIPLTSLEPTEPMTKRLKPHPDQDQTMVHCPRCDSTNTKFCYYNNYSLSQPRYFCKSCRRYWTKGGTLRNIPMGGVSRKHKKLYNHIGHQKPQQNQDQNVVSRNSIALQLSYPESSAHYSKLDNVTDFSNYPNFTFENLTIDFMESDGGGGSGSGECEGGDNFQVTVENGYELDTGKTHGASPVEEMMTYYHGHYDKVMKGNDVKPTLFDFDWRDQTGCHSDLYDLGVGRDGLSGYIAGLGSTWAGLMNGYGSSSTNPLV